MNRIWLICAMLLASLPAFASSALKHTGPRPSDSEIEATLHAKLAKSKVGKDGFTVHVKNGVATWQGVTGVMQHKGAATRMAKSAGAIQVVNNIRVSDEAKAKAVGALSGGARRVEIKKN